MTILSDRQIRTLCSDAYYVYQETDVFGETERRYVSEGQFRRMEHDPASQQVLRRMKVVRGQPMIAPFVAHSVREKGGALCTPPEGTPPQDPSSRKMVSYRTDVEKVISYGCSSYGYDVRLAREFKIFTNVNSTTVDPKQLDPKSFVDFEGDVCIIPPNSFILARTEERFVMPPDVVGLCVGKSTIARAGIITLCTPLEPGWEGYLTLEFANTTPLPAKMYAGEGALQIQFFQGPPCEVSYRDRGGKYQNQKPEITLPIA